MEKSKLTKEILTKVAALEPKAITRLHQLRENISSCIVPSDVIETEVKKRQSDYDHYSEYRLQLGELKELVLYRILHRTYSQGWAFVESDPNADHPLQYHHNKLLQMGYSLMRDPCPALVGGQFRCHYLSSTKMQDNDKQEIVEYVNEFYQQLNESNLIKAQDELKDFENHLLDMYNKRVNDETTANNLIEKLV